MYSSFYCSSWIACTSWKANGHLYVPSTECERKACLKGFLILQFTDWLIRTVKKTQLVGQRNEDRLK